MNLKSWFMTALRWFMTGYELSYHLIDIQETMEHPYFFWGKPTISTGPFSIAVLDYIPDARSPVSQWLVDENSRVLQSTTK